MKFCEPYRYIPKWYLLHITLIKFSVLLQRQWNSNTCELKWNIFLKVTFTSVKSVTLITYIHVHVSDMKSALHCYTDYVWYEVLITLLLISLWYEVLITLLQWLNVNIWLLTCGAYMEGILHSASSISSSSSSSSLPAHMMGNSTDSTGSTIWCFRNACVVTQTVLYDKVTYMYMTHSVSYAIKFHMCLGLHTFLRHWWSHNSIIYAIWNTLYSRYRGELFFPVFENKSA